MAYSTSSSLAGLMHTLVADTQAIFKTQSDLFNAVHTQESQNSNTVQFQSQVVPSGVTAHSEGSLTAAVAVSIGAVTATLETYPMLVSVSNKALSSGADISMNLGRTIAGSLAGTMDKAVAALFSSFTGGTVGSAGATLTVADIINAVAKLNATKYFGTKVIVLHPMHWAKVAKDLIAVSGMTKDEIVSRGYISNVFGAELYVSPWIAKDGSDDAVSAAFVKEAGIGLGYKNPVIDLSTAPNLAAVGQDILGESYFKAVMLNAGAGVTITGDVA